MSGGLGSVGVLKDQASIVQYLPILCQQVVPTWTLTAEGYLDLPCIWEGYRKNFGLETICSHHTCFQLPQTTEVAKESFQSHRNLRFNLQFAKCICFIDLFDSSFIIRKTCFVFLHSPNHKKKSGFIFKILIT